LAKDNSNCDFSVSLVSISEIYNLTGTKLTDKRHKQPTFSFASAGGDE